MYQRGQALLPAFFHKSGVVQPDIWGSVPLVCLCVMALEG